VLEAIFDDFIARRPIMKFEGTWTAARSAAPAWARDVIRSRACESTVTWGESEDVKDWRMADRELRGNARDRAALDAHEMTWLRVAERLQIWKPLGMVSMMDYMERALGYKPRTAQERLRVARALAELPRISEALARAEMKFSPARELCRVATRATEAAWLDRAAGKNMREIEEMVAGRQPGDLPDDPPDPDLAMRMLQIEVSGSTYALFCQARQVANDENGTNLEEDTFVARLCTVFLEATASDAKLLHETTHASDGDEKEGFVPGGVFMGRAKYQIASIVCERCGQGWQEGAGARIPIDAATVERMRCDAQYIGSLEGDGPERAYQDVPPATVRFIWRRDGGRCQTPGCRSTRGLEIHHIVPRSQGGSNDPRNLTLRCDACHGGHHDGRITISGIAPDQLHVERSHEPVERHAHVGATAKVSVTEEEAAMTARATLARSAHVGAKVSGRTTPTKPPSAFDATVTRTQARDALVGLGWKPHIAKAAIRDACAAIGDLVPVEVLIREALRRCPKRTSG
jgi:hypothetical protein